MIWVHVGDCVNVMDVADPATDMDDIKIQGFAVATISVDEMGGVPKILALV